MLARNKKRFIPLSLWRLRLGRWHNHLRTIKIDVHETTVLVLTNQGDKAGRTRTTCSCWDFRHDNT
jgi:hypothetical protein